jgi:predicted transcriptional regulator
VLPRDPKTFQVKLVPSVVLVDRQGTVRYTRAGVLTDDEVPALAQALPPLLQ